MKVLITGSSGGLGTSLKKFFPNAFCPTHKEMDVSNSEFVNKVILSYKPDLLIHAAAMVGIRECEENKEKARLTNVDGTKKCS